MVEIEERMTGHLLHSRVFCRFFWRVFPSAMLFSAMVWCFGLGSSRRAYGEIDAQIGSALVKAKERYLTLDFDGALALLEDATAQATIQATTPSDYQLLRDLYVERALNYFALSESDAASPDFYMVTEPLRRSFKNLLNVRFLIGVLRQKDSSVLRLLRLIKLLEISLPLVRWDCALPILMVV